MTLGRGYLPGFHVYLWDVEQILSFPLLSHYSSPHHPVSFNLIVVCESVCMHNHTCVTKLWKSDDNLWVSGLSCCVVFPSD